MNSDDLRLATIIEKGEGGDIVIVGSPFDFARRREGKKEGEDDGPCCLRRFFGRVGPLVNPEYGISIEKVRLSDYGNIRLQSSENESVPQKCIATIQSEVFRLIKNNKLPFIYGGSKEALYAGELAFHEVFPSSTKHFMISGLASLKRAYDHDKLSSSCALTLLTQKYPHSAVLFGVREKSKFFQVKSNSLFEQYSLEWIRQQFYEPGETYTQAGTIFKQILSKIEAHHVHVSLTVEVIERFRGCREVFSSGLTVQEVIQIFFLLGKSPKVKLVDISEFNSMKEDYQSSLLLVNLLYYFLMGWTQRKNNY